MTTTRRLGKRKRTESEVEIPDGVAEALTRIVQYPEFIADERVVKPLLLAAIKHEEAELLVFALDRLRHFSKNDADFFRQCKTALQQAIVSQGSRHIIDILMGEISNLASRIQTSYVDINITLMMIKERRYDVFPHWLRTPGGAACVAISRGRLIAYIGVSFLMHPQQYDMIECVYKHPNFSMQLNRPDQKVLHQVLVPVLYSKVCHALSILLAGVTDGGCVLPPDMLRKIVMHLCETYRI